MNKNKQAKLLAAIAVFAMVACAFAVVMPAEESDAAVGDTTYISGQITSSQTYGNGTNVIVNGDLTIPEDMSLTISGTAKFTINEGNTLTIKTNGTLNITGETPVVTINGDILNQGTIANDTTYDFEGKKGVIVNGTITSERGGTVTNSVTMNGTTATGVEEDTATGAKGDIVIGKDGALNMSKRYSPSSIENQNIYLNAGATLTLNCKITDVGIYAVGSGTYYTAGAFTVNAEKTSADGTKVSNLKFTVTTKNVPALLDQTKTAQKVTLKQFIVNVDGSVDADDVVSVAVGESINNAKKDANKTQVYYGTDLYDNYTSTEESNPIVRGHVITPLSSIDGALTVNKGSTFEVAENTYLQVPGTLKVLGTFSETPESGKITLAGTMDVTGTVDCTVMYDNLKTGGTLKVIGGEVKVTTVMPNLGAKTTAPISLEIYGTVYYVDGESTTTIYVKDFDKAIADAAAAEVTDVTVYSYGSQNRADSEGAIWNGAFELKGDITIPDGMTVTIWNSLVIADGATLTLSEGATIEIYDNTKGGQTRDNPGKLFVKGKLIDYSGCMEELATEDGFIYEVEKITETEEIIYSTYTTLRIALDEAVAGEKIQLNGAIVIDEDLTIPKDITVITDEFADSETVVMTLKGAVLTVDGVLVISGDSTITFTDMDGKKSNIVVNNIIKNADTSTFTDGTNTVTVAGAYFSGQISEDDAEGTNYVTSVVVAAAYSEKMTDADSEITICGKVNAGDVTFTQAADAGLTVIITDDAEVKFGTLTLAGAGLTVTGTVTGTVDIPVTAGTTTFDLNKVQNIVFNVKPYDDGETVTTTVVFNGVATKQVYGTVTLQAGEAAIGEDTWFFAGDETTPYAKLIVSSGAKLIVSADVKLADSLGKSDLTALTDSKVQVIDLEKIVAEKATFVVDGTVDVAKGGKLNWGVSDINGQLNVLKDGALNLTVAVIDGTVVIDEAVGADKATMEITALRGTITGDIIIDAISNSMAGFLLAYPGSTQSIYTDDEGTFTGKKTDVYLNGELFFTTYADGEDVEFNTINKFVFMKGLDKNKSKYYTDAGLTETADTSKVIGDYAELYIEMEPAEVTGTISAGVGLKIYLDGISVDAYKTNDGYTLDVGDYVVTIENQAGYDKSNAVITLNGATVENGSEITISENGFVITATGAVPATGGSSSSSSNSDDGMGITDYLLIVLVVLAAILVVIVALRMMRS